MIGNFNGKNQKNNPVPSGSINLIGAETNIKGEVNSDGDIRIDGSITGMVTSKAKVVVGSTGSVEGNIHCENADVSGIIKGDVHVIDLLFLKKNSRLDGDIFTNKMVVEAGAIFNGSCTMGQKEISDYGERTARQLEEEAV